jgi:rubrerythrin
MNLLIEAMNSELKAKDFYLKAAEKARSQAGKSLFRELASFEENHYSKVKEIIKSINQGIDIEKSKEKKPIKNVKSEIEGEIEPNKDEIVVVINLAIEAEKNAQERYRQIAGILTDPNEKTIFEELANEERNHQSILEHQFYHLSNEGSIIWE